MDSSICSHEAPGMSVRPTLPGRIRSPTIWSRPRTNVTEPGECPGVWSTRRCCPAGVVGVHVEGGVRLSEHHVQCVHVVGVAVGYEDGSHGPTDGGQDPLRLGPGVDYDVALGGVDDVGVHIEAIH